MRRLLGLLLLLYGLALAFNTTVPYVAELTGKKVVASEGGDSFVCMSPLGAPPYAGIQGNCLAGWEGTATGKVFGAEVDEKVLKGKSAPAYTLPGLTTWAFLPVSTAEKVAGVFALLFIIIGIGWLFRRRRKRRRGHGHGDDHDDDDDDSDSGDSSSDGDSGGSDGGGGGD